MTMCMNLGSTILYIMILQGQVGLDEPSRMIRVMIRIDERREADRGIVIVEEK